LFFKYRDNKIIKYEGIILPIKDNKNAEKGDNAPLPQIAVLRASGIEILLSKIGHIDTKIMASQTQLEKLFLKKSIRKSILYNIGK
jgi:hypothetical protein